MPIFGITASQIQGHLVVDSFDSIATISASGLATATFSSIPQTYKSLHIRVGVNDSNNITTGVRFNGDTSASYGASTSMYITTPSNVLGSSSSTTTGTLLSLAPSGYTSSSVFVPSMIDIFDYTSTNKNKLATSIGGLDSFKIYSSEWVNTAAITSITFYIPTGTWGTGCTFELYGVK